MPENDGTALVRLLERVDDCPQGSPDVPAGLVRLCHLAVELVPGCDHATVTVGRAVGRGGGRAGDGLETTAASGPVARRFDALQHEHRRGPVADAAARGVLVLVDDLGSDERYPAFGPMAVAATGVRSVVSCRLHVDDDTVAVLTLQGEAAGALGSDAVAAAGILAGRAAVALVRAGEQERVDHLTTALSTNRRIGVAIGVIMVARRVTESQAFELLRGASQAANRKLRDIADDVVLTGALPQAAQARRP